MQPAIEITQKMLVAAVYWGNRVHTHTLSLSLSLSLALSIYCRVQWERANSDINWNIICRCANMLYARRILCCIGPGWMKWKHLECRSGKIEQTSERAKSIDILGKWDERAMCKLYTTHWDQIISQRNRIFLSLQNCILFCLLSLSLVLIPCCVVSLSSPVYTHRLLILPLVVLPFNWNKVSTCFTVLCQYFRVCFAICWC